MNLFSKQKQSHGLRKQTVNLTGGRMRGKDRLGG